MKISNINTRKLSISFLILILLMVVIGLTSCVSQKRIAKICATCPVVTNVVTIKDSSVTKETIKHDTLYFAVEGPTVVIPGPCDKFCDSKGNLKPFHSETNHNGIKQTLDTDPKNNTIIQKCNVDSLQKIIDQKTIEITNWKSKSEVTTKPPVEVNILNGWQVFMIRSGYALWLILILLIGYKVLKIYNKIPKI